MKSKRILVKIRAKKALEAKYQVEQGIPLALRIKNLKSGDSIW